MTSFQPSKVILLVEDNENDVLLLRIAFKTPNYRIDPYSGSGSNRKVKRSTRRPVVNCDSTDWGFKLISYLEKQREVDLINAHFEADWAILQDAADRFCMTFERDHESRMVRFRRKPD
jgi:hypothetical protein